jgi:hypothetical protein
MFTPFARQREQPKSVDFVTGTAWFVAACAATGVFDEHPLALAKALSQPGGTRSTYWRHAARAPLHQ